MFCESITVKSDIFRMFVDRRLRKFKNTAKDYSPVYIYHCNQSDVPEVITTPINDH